MNHTINSTLAPIQTDFPNFTAEVLPVVVNQTLVYVNETIKNITELNQTIINNQNYNQTIVNNTFVNETIIQNHMNYTLLNETINNFLNNFTNFTYYFHDNSIPEFKEFKILQYVTLFIIILLNVGTIFSFLISTKKFVTRLTAPRGNPNHRPDVV